MKRTPLRRTGPPNAKSARREREDRKRQRLRVQLQSERGVRCEWPGCRRSWDDMHEVRSRARGGSITDPLNIVCLCRRHHDWVTTEPVLSRHATVVTWIAAAWGWPVPVLRLTKHSWE